MKSIILFIYALILGLLLVGCSTNTITDENDYVNISEKIIIGVQDSADENKDTFELRDGVLLTINHIAYDDSLIARSYSGELYDIFPKGNESYKFVIIDVTFVASGDEKVEFIFKQAQIKDQLRLKTIQSDTFYDKLCIPNVYENPLISCEFTAGSYLQMQKGDIFRNKLLFAIPEAETPEKLSYFFYTNEQSISLE